MPDPNEEPVLERVEAALVSVEALVVRVIEQQQILEANSEKLVRAVEDLDSNMRVEIRLALSELVRGQIR